MRVITLYSINARANTGHARIEKREKNRRQTRASSIVEGTIVESSRSIPKSTYTKQTIRSNRNKSYQASQKGRARRKLKLHTEDPQSENSRVRTQPPQSKMVHKRMKQENTHKRRTNRMIRTKSSAIQLDNYSCSKDERCSPLRENK